MAWPPSRPKAEGCPSMAMKNSISAADIPIAVHPSDRLANGRRVRTLRTALLWRVRLCPSSSVSVMEPGVAEWKLPRTPRCSGGASSLYSCTRVGVGLATACTLDQSDMCLAVQAGKTMTSSAITTILIIVLVTRFPRILPSWHRKV